ncbi:MAG: UDP-glucose 4-epimerase GalE [Christensenellales bacterium]|jgi:UDP-glucose 4-epimerase
MILVTGGTGYIGSHTCVELLSLGYDVVILDNFINSTADVAEKLEAITGKKVILKPMDVCERGRLDEIFEEYEIDAVIHFAGLKAVGESVEQPLCYYRNNINSTLALCESMSKHGVHKFIFSSSATVYQNDNPLPFREDARLGCTNPYGWTKFISEQILRDVYAADPRWAIMLLRYFNPIGAHKSGLIGEAPKGIPNNLMPYVAKVAAQKLPKLSVFGNDYPTKDGTGVRDYIHVVDLAKGHVAALQYIQKHTGVEAVNLGTGKGYSTLEVVSAFEKATGRPVPYEITERRPGDIAECVANASRAAQLLGWKAELGIEEMCADAWRFEYEGQLDV